MSEEEKKYRIGRYFDDHLETYVAGGLTKEEAIKVRNKFNEEARVYVSYEIREEPIRSDETK